jgi:hypothetical protein
MKNFTGRPFFSLFFIARANQLARATKKRENQLAKIQAGIPDDNHQTDSCVRPHLLPLHHRTAN